MIQLSGSPEEAGGGKASKIEQTHFLPFDISFADSCRTSSGILSHWLSERHRSISVSSRDPDFLAVIFWWLRSAGLDQTKTPQEAATTYRTVVKFTLRKAISGGYF